MPHYNPTKENAGALVPDRYLDESSFCSLYGVRPRTAQRWRVTGDGPAFVRIGPRRIAYRLSDCEAWAARRTFAHRAEELAHSVAGVAL